MQRLEQTLHDWTLQHALPAQVLARLPQSGAAMCPWQQRTIWSDEGVTTVVCGSALPNLISLNGNKGEELPST